MMLYSIGLLISVIFLLATLATGFILPSNHHVLHWRCQTFYVGCLLVGDLLLAINQIFGADISGFPCFAIGKFAILIFYFPILRFGSEVIVTARMTHFIRSVAVGTVVIYHNERQLKTEINEMTSFYFYVVAVVFCLSIFHLLRFATTSASLIVLFRLINYVFAMKRMLTRLLWR